MPHAEFAAIYNRLCFLQKEFHKIPPHIPSLPLPLYQDLHEVWLVKNKERKVSAHFHQ